MIIKNPMDATEDQYQHLSWKHLKDKTTYFLELIKPKKGPISYHTNSTDNGGAYWTLAVEVLEESITNMYPLVKGEKIVIDFPVKTFQRSWAALSRILRREFTIEHNLKIKFTKITKKNIFIHTVERMESSPEHSKFADEIYLHPEIYSPEKSVKAVIRREEKRY